MKRCPDRPSESHLTAESELYTQELAAWGHVFNAAGMLANNQGQTEDGCRPPKQHSGGQEQRSLRVHRSCRSTENDERMLSMRVLLRDSQSDEYFVERGQWTYSMEDAFDFRDTRYAVQAAPKTGRAELEIVLSFDDPSSNAAIPLDNRPIIRRLGEGRMSLATRGISPTRNMLTPSLR